MIPLRDQDLIRQRFDSDLTSRVRIDFFGQKPSRIFVSGRDECVYCEDVRTVLEELAALSPRLALTVHEFADEREAAAALGVDKVPAIVVRGQMNRSVRFFGAPFGNEFVGLIETLIEAASGRVDLAPESVRALRRVKSDVHLQVFVTPTCPYSPVLSRSAFKLGLQSPRIKTDIVEVGEFPALAQRYGVRAVPMTIINETIVLLGAIDEMSLIQAVGRAAEGKPLSAEEAERGPFTPLAARAQQTQAPATTASGLIVPR